MICACPVTLSVPDAPSPGHSQATSNFLVVSGRIEGALSGLTRASCPLPRQRAPSCRISATSEIALRTWCQEERDKPSPGLHGCVFRGEVLEQYLKPGILRAGVSPIAFRNMPHTKASAGDGKRGLIRASVVYCLDTPEKVAFLHGYGDRPCGSRRSTARRQSPEPRVQRQKQWHRQTRSDQKRLVKCFCRCLSQPPGA